MATVRQREAAIDVGERVYALRKMGRATGVKLRELGVVPVGYPKRPLLVSEQPPTDLEMLRIELDAHPNSHPRRRDLEKFAQAPWLLFASEGPSEIIMRALKTVPAVQLARALLMLDPVLVGDAESAAIAATLAEIARVARGDACALLKTAAKVRGCHARKALDHEQQHLGRHAAIVDGAARLLRPPSGAWDGRWRGQRLPKPVENELAAQRRHHWTPVNLLLDAAGWFDTDIAELIETGDAWRERKRGWAFQLCPVQCARARTGDTHDRSECALGALERGRPDDETRQRDRNGMIEAIKSWRARSTDER